LDDASLGLSHDIMINIFLIFAFTTNYKVLSLFLTLKKQKGMKILRLTFMANYINQEEKIISVV
jgi:hypothetical protein